MLMVEGYAAEGPNCRYCYYSLDFHCFHHLSFQILLLLGKKDLPGMEETEWTEGKEGKQLLVEN